MNLIFILPVNIFKHSQPSAARGQPRTQKHLSGGHPGIMLDPLTPQTPSQCPCGAGNGVPKLKFKKDFFCGSVPQLSPNIVGVIIWKGGHPMVRAPTYTSIRHHDEFWLLCTFSSHCKATMPDSFRNRTTLLFGKSKGGVISVTGKSSSWRHEF